MREATTLDLTEATQEWLRAKLGFAYERVTRFMNPVARAQEAQRQLVGERLDVQAESFIIKPCGSLISMMTGADIDAVRLSRLMSCEIRCGNAAYVFERLAPGGYRTSETSWGTPEMGHRIEILFSRMP